MSNSAIAKPLTLKCGLTLPNRLTKAAMAENWADNEGLPSKAIHAPYGEWADGGWGLVMTGNVEVDLRYLGQPKDTAYNDKIPYERMLEAWKAWAAVCNRNGTPTIVQVNHPGRQSPLGAGKRGLFEKTIAPSAVPLDLGAGLIPRLLNSLLFGTPREMTVAEIDDVVRRFAQTAKLASDAGFAGIELHAAHGYLLAQFMSDKVNRRTDAYGGSPAARAKIVVDIVRAVRAAVPASFCVGIKFNSVDHQSRDELDACIEQLKLITEAGVDFLEVSGGSYEDPVMATGVADEKKSDRTKAREAFFLEFARAIRRDFPDVPLMVTGGFRSRQGMEAALANNGCDLIGLGRPAVLNPALPKNTILAADVGDDDAKLYARKIEAPWIAQKLGVKAIGAGAESAWYAGMIRKLGIVAA
ncbi:NADH:flavin oxidoreductase/NADH oxidase [Colletotrichum higginsianum IMI 349063]|uniref:NADH:flavin oxidoreductase/NADH oxidase n=3 Tax=Colletotrichum higginsianum TaxID=80884 RepID=A0A1B7Y0U6_COLHI|nr:NADH:flavin oxidoreductase/NADH oxidase [Colletotrichum higginsianum IMI 349063]OBR05603.1 NADH:flavin oxidoreductase/NADH oxidase [Colletotrichum higginsianum IMI 349063]TIC90659.1 NADH oxidase [Colletotrichum higginsianum]GJD04121.1 NADH:flavin oxidoreductase/NADH oxidase [Colletotrichum higginsianum]